MGGRGGGSGMKKKAGGGGNTGNGFSKQTNQIAEEMVKGDWAQWEELKFRNAKPFNQEMANTHARWTYEKMVINNGYSSDVQREVANAYSGNKKPSKKLLEHIENNKKESLRIIHSKEWLSSMTMKQINDVGWNQDSDNRKIDNWMRKKGYL